MSHPSPVPAARSRRRRRSAVAAAAAGPAAAAAALMMSAAGASGASAAENETVIENAWTAPYRMACQGDEEREFGQSITSPIDGWLVEVGLWVGTWETEEQSRTVTTGLRVVEGAGLSGTTLSGPQDVDWQLEAATQVLQMVELDEPVAVEIGDVITVGMPQNCSVRIAWGGDSAGFGAYAGGDGFVDSFNLGDDLAFRAVFVDELVVDEDGDGVVDGSDVCPGSNLSAEADAPSGGLKPNHLWSTGDGFVDRNGTVRYTFDDTGGCSATQIIAEARLGIGHARFGISPDAMAAWVATLA